MREPADVLAAVDVRAVRLAVVAAVASVLLVGVAVIAHAVDGPPLVWVAAALGALAARPVAVLRHRRARGRDGSAARGTSVRDVCPVRRWPISRAARSTDRARPQGATVTQSHQTEQSEQDDGPDEGGGQPITLQLGNEEIVLRQRYEFISLINEIGIALFFTVGSVAFYWHELFNLGVTLFVIGSVQLGIRPAIRIARRTQLRSVTKGMPHEVARDF